MAWSESQAIFKIISSSDLCTCTHGGKCRWKRQGLPSPNADPASKELSPSVPLKVHADLSRKLFDTIVYVKVGKDLKAFGLHKGLLCNRSAYFRAALEGNFKEAKEQVVLLPEDDVDVFELFQFWLYSGNLLDTGESIVNLSASLLVSLYLFAETRCIPQLQDMTIDALIHHIEVTNTFPTGSIPQIYDNTTETSPLRRLLVDVAAREGERRNGSWFSEERQHLYNRTFLIDLVVALYDRNPKARVQDFTGLRCDYHVHTEAEGCYVSQEKREPRRGWSPWAFLPDRRPHTSTPSQTARTSLSNS